MSVTTRPLSPETVTFVNKALDELRKRKVIDGCPRCQTNDWNVDYLAIPALEPPTTTKMWQPSFQPSGYLPMLAIVCKNCGYTIFHNASVLNLPTE